MILTDENLLRQPCEAVSSLEEAQEIIFELEKELKLSGDRGFPGIGLAAPQIGIYKKCAIIRLNDEIKIDLVNARIAQGYDLDNFEEGCLSFPTKTVKTKRYREVYVVDNLVKPFRFSATQLLAVALQHEIDHYESKLLIDFERNNGY